MTPQELKNSILQLAIQGKLVPQRAEEGSAEELYKQIQAEKKKLIKEKKIKKEPPLPEITDDEKPFDIPETWKWVRLYEILDVRDGTHDTPKYVIKGIPLVTSKNLINNTIDFATTKLISYEDAKNINIRSAVNTDDILFAMIGTIGNPVLVKKDREFCIKNMALFKSIDYKLFDMKYLFWYLQKEQDTMRKKASGGVQSFVSLKYLRNYFFPLPPLAEQKRIVAKIEELLLPYVEQYEKAYNELQELDKRFPGDLQKSILQLAIQGRLLPQRAEEGNAEELYKQIQAEKKKLIKEKKIKKEKPLPEITAEEKPFEIPETWKWVRLGDVGSWASGATPARANTDYYGGKIPWLKTGDLNDGDIIDTSEYITELALKNTSVRLNPVGSVLMAMYGATIGKIGILKIDATTNQACCACIPYNGIFNKYLFYFLLSYRKDFIKMGAGGAQPNISKEKIVNTTIPLPPLAEQKRIVAKIEELLPLCDKLK